MKALVKSSLAVVVLLALSAGVFIFNPFNWFTRESERFTRERFEAVQPGMRKHDLVKLLGEPLRVIRPPIPSHQCEDCVTYYFMGDPPGWLPGCQEAWVYVDGHGVVRGKVWNVEP